ncbi:autoinducer binding domain-containing protein [Pseudomonas sp. RP23018S]|uniref:autoinducer binding domain-containing protein n=1 Tax=Pseudomonas sp. RP23018S TaxID=3096037 RepID=UPI002ACA2BBF|nr:autoinducer binding domain-containing protein [Pseudomonas sp. RP23018S]MDZ5604700.1 autoinducer binding domain-containing protein [Pseudomonas sp. RP23018S]
MPHWTPDQLQDLLEKRDPPAVFERAIELAQVLGMTHLGLRLHVHSVARGANVVFYNNYPREWNEQYQREELSGVDPIKSMCHHTTLPVLWDEAHFSAASEFRQAACRHGLRHGWTQAVHGLRGHESHLSVSRPSGKISLAEFYEKGAEVLWLCNTLHAVLGEHHKAQLEAESPVSQLSERELEVLRWSAAGKTAADIACILSLSQSTVNFHIRSVISKTNASNKAGAIAIAARQGII